MSIFLLALIVGFNIVFGRDLLQHSFKPETFIGAVLVLCVSYLSADIWKDALPGTLWIGAVRITGVRTPDSGVVSTSLVVICCVGFAISTLLSLPLYKTAIGKAQKACLVGAIVFLSVGAADLRYLFISISGMCCLLLLALVCPVHRV
jgi:hypothetical protein